MAQETDRNRVTISLQGNNSKLDLHGITKISRNRGLNGAVHAKRGVGATYKSEKAKGKAV